MRKSMTKITSLMLAGAMVIGSMGVTADAAATVSLNKTSATITVGKTVKLTVSKTNKVKKVKSKTWSSSNKKVATVAGGTVTGKKAGTATIKCKVVFVNKKDKEKTKTLKCTVTVKKKASSTEATETPVETTPTEATETPADATEAPADATEAPADATEVPADASASPAADASASPAASASASPAASASASPAASASASPVATATATPTATPAVSTAPTATPAPVSVDSLASATPTATASTTPATAAPAITDDNVDDKEDTSITFKGLTLTGSGVVQIGYKKVSDASGDFGNWTNVKTDGTCKITGLEANTSYYFTTKLYGSSRTTAEYPEKTLEAAADKPSVDAVGQEGIWSDKIVITGLENTQEIRIIKKGTTSSSQSSAVGTWQDVTLNDGKFELTGLDSGMYYTIEVRTKKTETAVASKAAQVDPADNKLQTGKKLSITGKAKLQLSAALELADPAEGVAVTLSKDNLETSFLVNGKSGTDGTWDIALDSDEKLKCNANVMATVSLSGYGSEKVPVLVLVKGKKPTVSAGIIEVKGTDYKFVKEIAGEGGATTPIPENLQYAFKEGDAEVEESAWKKVTAGATIGTTDDYAEKNIVFRIAKGTSGAVGSIEASDPTDAKTVDSLQAAN